MLLPCLVTFLVSLVAVLWGRRWFARHAAVYSARAPQRFHVGAVSRLGGLGMGTGWLVGLGLLATPALSEQDGMAPRQAVAIGLLVALPLVVGVLEDITQGLPVRLRLVATGCAGLLAVAWLDVRVSRLEVDALDALLAQAPWLAAALAVVAMAGLPHAFNIIDGYNGLAGSVAVIIGLALAYVALQVGDRQLAALSLTLVAATLGFLVWNFPWGLVFAGDGGAYLWGTVTALVSILLVQRHPQVSPWFVMLLLVYPVWETLFSIYRKWARGDSPGMADALHLHQLVYRRVVRAVLTPDEARSVLARNNRTTPWLIGFCVLSVAPAVLFWRTAWVLRWFCLAFVMAYVGVYLGIVRFKIPRWVRR